MEQVFRTESARIDNSLLALPDVIGPSKDCTHLAYIHPLGEVTQPKSSFNADVETGEGCQMRPLNRPDT